MWKVIIVLLLFSGPAVVSAKEVYVSPDGSDKNPGTRRQPVGSLRQARQALRAAKGGAIWLAAGQYHVSDGFSLEAAEQTRREGIARRTAVVKAELEPVPESWDEGTAISSTGHLGRALSAFPPPLSFSHSLPRLVRGDIVDGDEVVRPASASLDGSARRAGDSGP